MRFVVYGFNYYAITIIHRIVFIIDWFSENEMAACYLYGFNATGIPVEIL